MLCYKICGENRDGVVSRGATFLAAALAALSITGAFIGTSFVCAIIYSILIFYFFGFYGHTGCSPPSTS